MARPIHTWATCLVALFFLGSALADSGVPVPTEPTRFPGSNIALQDGDIILNTTYSILGALNSQYGFPRGRYSHVLVYVKGANTPGTLVNYTDDGLELKPASKLVLSNELALVRPKKAPPPDALLAALKQLEARTLHFDYDMRWRDLGSDATYCAGFVSQLYRLAGMPDPYPPNSPDEVSRGYMERWAAENLGFDITQTVSPNKVLTVKDYQLVAVYTPANIEGSIPRIVARTVTRKVQGYIEEDHMQQLPPRAGSRFLIGLTGLGMMDKNILARMPEKRKQPLAQLLEFFSAVEARVERYVSLHDDVDWKEGNIEELAAVVSDQYRDRFFIKSAAN